MNCWTRQLPGRHAALNEGFTLAEVLVALALTGVLLTSVAVALQSGLQSFDQNDELASMTQNARAILSKMGHEIRASEETTADAASVTIFPVDDGSGLTQIQYELVNGDLWYRKTVNGVQTSYLLLGSTEKTKCTGFTADGTPGTDSKGTGCTKVVTATLTLTSDNQTFTVTASAAPRRNQTF